MSEVEKSPMDKRNTSSRQLALPSTRSVNETGGNINKFPGSYQKRDFANDPSTSKKYLQPREKVNFKENGGSNKKFGSNQRRDSGNTDPVGTEIHRSKKFSQVWDKDYDGRVQLEGSSPRRGRNSSNAKRDVNCAQSQEFGYRPWKDKSYAYHRRSSKTPYSKEQFLQANCQFVVIEGGNYAIHTIDPDTLVDWDLIEQVRIFDNEVPSCPICLYPPKAAKITRCGHSYCWPCMLHYMSLFDETYVNCPICFARVREKDLKSVVALQTMCFSIGQEITMKLMKKSRGQTLVSPRPIWNSELKRPFSVTDMENMSFAKLLTADLNYIEKIIDAERAELLMLQQEDNPDTLEGSFIAAAMKSLEDRAVKLKSENLPSYKLVEADVLPSGSPKDTTVDDVLSAVHRSNKDCIAATKRYASAFSDEELAEESELTPNFENVADDVNNVIEEGQDQNDIESTCLVSDIIHSLEDTSVAFEKEPDMTGPTEEVSEINAKEELGCLEPKASYYKNKRERSEAAYFYQCADGQHIYLHGLNVSCLKAQYGDLSNCPDELTGRIVDLERIFMDEELRKKYRWLNHLPLTCEFMMAELDLKPPLVSQEILDHYANDILKRQQERDRKLHYDNKRTQRIQNEECRKMGIDPHSRIVRSEFKRGFHPSSISSIDAVFSSLPSVNQWNKPEVLSRSPDSLATDENVVESGVSRNSCSSEDTALLPTVPSFAQMLKMGNPKPAATLGAWDKATQAAEEKKESNASNSDEEELARAPVFQYALMCDIGEKLAELDRAGNNEDVSEESSCNNGKKKKKKLKKLLFTSGHMFHNKH